MHLIIVVNRPTYHVDFAHTDHCVTIPLGSLLDIDDHGRAVQMVQRYLIDCLAVLIEMVRAVDVRAHVLRCVKAVPGSPEYHKKITRFIKSIVKQWF